ncbi:MAG: hypothetical protein WBJ54_12265 [Syntrophorhabdus sp.]|nr:hypothetical protein [Pseudomonadota bacterium]
METQEALLVGSFPAFSSFEAPTGLSIEHGRSAVIYTACGQRLSCYMLTFQSILLKFLGAFGGMIVYCCTSQHKHQ